MAKIISFVFLFLFQANGKHCGLEMIRNLHENLYYSDKNMILTLIDGFINRGGA